MIDALQKIAVALMVLSGAVALLGVVVTFFIGVWRRLLLKYQGDLIKIDFVEKLFLNLPKLRTKTDYWSVRRDNNTYWFKLMEVEHLSDNQTPPEYRRATADIGRTQEAE